MRTFDINEAKTQLSRLVEEAANGESFVISTAGKPMVKVIALNAPEPSKVQRFGFMAGQNKVPDDFDRMCEADIAKIFEGAS